MHCIDSHVGRSVRARRETLKIPEIAFARDLQISLAALQSKEAATSRFLVAELEKVCALLAMRPADIYAGLELEAEMADPQPGKIANRASQAKR